jgi:hypothetical protein
MTKNVEVSVIAVKMLSPTQLLFCLAFLSIVCGIQRSGSYQIRIPTLVSTHARMMVIYSKISKSKKSSPNLKNSETFDAK